MYQILVVDDEAIERKGIVSLLKKYKYPADVHEAKNGREALKLLKGRPIDIMITDIRMPIMDGIQLMNETSVLYPNLQIVVNSAYADFAYAQEAMRCGAVNYILKPVNLTEFRSVMEAVLQNCKELSRQTQERINAQKNQKEIQQYRAAGVLEGLLRAGEGEELPQSVLDWYMRNISEPLVLMVALSQRNFFNLHGTAFAERLKKVQLQPLYSVNLSENETVLIFLADAMPPENELGKKAEQLIDALRLKTGAELFLIMGEEVYNPKAMVAEYQALSAVGEYTFFLSRGEVIFHKNGYLDVNSFSMVDSGIMEAIYEDIQYSNYEKLLQDVQVLTTTLEKKSAYSRIYVQCLFGNIFQKLYDKVPELALAQLDECMHKIFEIVNYRELCRYVLDEVVRVAKYAGQVQQMYEGEQRIVHQVQKIVAREYANDELGVPYIAELVGLSSNYLGNLYKKATGESLAKFIRNFRMEKARGMLLETSTRILDIARLTGFSNDSYFVSVFRTQYGFTPAKFRENQGVEFGKNTLQLTEDITGEKNC